MAEVKQPPSFSGMSRRELLKLTPLALAGMFAIPALQEKLLDSGIGFSDKAAGALFRKHHEVQLYSDRDVAPLEKFPYNGYDVIEPDFDIADWKLQVSGAVTKPGEYTLAQIMALPKMKQNTRHVCVEGWDVIGNYGGCRLADFMTLVGADTHARFMQLKCADDYYESYDMDSCLHPNTLLAYEMYGQPLDRGHGAPLRLQMPVKLGYKQAKYITELEVTNVLRPERGYWEDQGYSWFGGL